MAAHTDVDALRERAEAWLVHDPDPVARAELRHLIDSLPGTADDLADRFVGPLTFGTAGLRGPLRAGPNGMNLAVVTRAAAGLVSWLAHQAGKGPLIIGYDARHGSRVFAEQTARVATGAGREVLLLPGPLPTPVLAHAVRAFDAVAGVMVTASHNPSQDNGYKVYLGAQLGGPAGAGAQLVSPADAEIEAAITAVGPLAEVGLGDLGTSLDHKIIDRYVDGAVDLVAPRPGRPATAREIGAGEVRVAYTPLHGVGGTVFAAAFARAGFAPPAFVAAQAAPDPDFPTVAFPNPEEPGAMDLVIDLAAATGADLAIANDPDADRCAVAVPVPTALERTALERTAAGGTAAGGWRMLRGDELGILLADHLMRRDTRGVYATTIVSSSLLGTLCAARGRPYAQTLTGFKWIMRAAQDLAFGYEEALGYCVAPHHVRDKDGITAALLVTELATELKAAGRTLLDRLDELAAEFGVHATDQLAVRVTDTDEIRRAMALLRQTPPDTLLGEEVTGVEDLLPDNDVLTVRTRSVRVVVRPSGTEPKLKAYLEVVEPVTDGDVATARSRADAALQALRGQTATALGLD